jgi:16S rRNA (guanine(966)-N(2))-methyltransferase RsmD
MKDSGNNTKALRPTTGKVREALFNILRGKIENTCFLDLYAGTGAVGIEALKQGASEVTFVEASKSCAKNISEGLNKFRFTVRARVITKKALSFIEWAEINRMTFDIIFLDPPYHKDEILQALSAIGELNILKDNGIVIAEHFTKKQLPDEFNNLQKVKDYNYGDTVLSFYKKR